MIPHVVTSVSEARREESLNDVPPLNCETPVSRLSAVSLASVLDQSVDCIKLIDLDGNIRYMNANGLCAMGIDDFCSINGQAWADLWPAEARRAITASYIEATAGKTVRFRAHCPTLTGASRWWDVSVSPVSDDDKQLAGFLTVSRDVTANQLTRQALTLAAAELKHRIRNAYQMIVSLLIVTADGNAMHEEFAQHMAARLKAVSSAQLLFAESDAPCNLQELVLALVSPFESPATQITFGDFPLLFVEQPQADAIALVVGELAVNASKHGALAHGGSIDVSAVHEKSQLIILWTEHVGRVIQQHGRSGGQGMSLMTQIMQTRGGDLVVAWKEQGLNATLTFDLAA